MSDTHERLADGEGRVGKIMQNAHAPENGLIGG
jgi:hypothetical protein